MVNQSIKRSWPQIVKKRFWPALIAFSVIVSVALWGFSHSKHLYRIENGLKIQSGIPQEIASPVQERMIASLRQSLPDAGISASESRIIATITTDNSNQGYVALTGALESAARTGNEFILASKTQQREEIARRVSAAVAEYNAAQSQVDKIEQAHPDLNDSATGPTARLERLVARQEERASRQKVVEEQIQRTQEYAKKMRELGTSSANQDTSAAVAPKSESPVASSSSVDRDPEVMQLVAQMQLLDEQLDEQLSRLRRTEQHPYVVDLRTRQAALQQKLRAARDRAVAGQPPPPAAVAAAGNTSSITPNMMAVQAAEFQLQQLATERGQIASELAQLKEQESTLRSQIDALRPVREQLRQARESAASLKQNRELAEAKLRAFDDVTRVGGSGPVTVETLSSDYKTPIWPRADVILMIAAGCGLFGALVIAMLFEKMDHTYQTPERFAALTGAPVLGVVDEIYSPQQWKWNRLWRWIGRPAVFAALLAYPAINIVNLMR